MIKTSGSRELKRLSARGLAYTDAKSGVEYCFVTNAHHLKAKAIANVYKERWRIELFFTWIKQNLKIKTFLVTSSNAVLTQIWIALCVYLLVAYLNFKAKLGISMQQILRLLQLNLFARRNLIELFKPPVVQVVDSPQRMLWENLYDSGDLKITNSWQRDTKHVFHLSSKARGSLKR